MPPPSAVRPSATMRRTPGVAGPAVMNAAAGAAGSSVSGNGASGTTAGAVGAGAAAAGSAGATAASAAGTDATAGRPAGVPFSATTVLLTSAEMARKAAAT